MNDVNKELSLKLSKTSIGDPQVEGVRMGSLAGKEQVEEVSEKINQLSDSQEIIFQKNLELVGVDNEDGAFIRYLISRRSVSCSVVASVSLTRRLS